MFKSFYVTNCTCLCHKSNGVVCIKLSVYVNTDQELIFINKVDVRSFFKLCNVLSILIMNSVPEDFLIKLFVTIFNV